MKYNVLLRLWKPLLIGAVAWVLLFAPLLAHCQGNTNAQLSEYPRVLPLTRTFSQVFPVGNKDYVRNAFVPVVSGSDTILYFIDYFGNAVRVKPKAVNANSIYVGSGTVPVGVVATVTRDITFLGNPDAGNPLTNAPFKIKRDGNEPSLQAWIANGDSVQIRRSDNEFDLHCFDSKFVLSGGRDLAIAYDSAVCLSPFRIQQLENTATGGLLVRNSDGAGKVTISIDDDGLTNIISNDDVVAILIDGDNVTMRNLIVAEITTLNLYSDAQANSTATGTYSLSTTRSLNRWFPAADQTNLTIAFPSAPIPGQLAKIYFGRAVTGAITWNGNGNPVLGSPPTTAAVNAFMTFQLISGFGWVKTN